MKNEIQPQPNSARPAVFIGSSTEGLPVATILKEALQPDLEVVLWNENVFEVGEDTLTSLIKLVSVFDFGIFVIGEDDIVRCRETNSPAPRDNVIFELGLFVGALGRRRAFPVIVPAKNGERIKLPSDLLGNTETRLSRAIHGTAEDQSLVESELKPLKLAILKRAEKAYLQLLPSTGLAVGYYKNFLLPVCSTLIETGSILIDDAEVDLSGDNFEFNIVLPSLLAEASRHGARRFVKENNLKTVNLSPNGGGRSYPFYVHADTREGRLQVFDFPTTLGASYRAIEIALANGFLGSTEHREILERKEIRNFQRALEILIAEPEATEFARNIRFIQQTTK